MNTSKKWPIVPLYTEAYIAARIDKESGVGMTRQEYCVVCVRCQATHSQYDTPEGMPACLLSYGWQLTKDGPICDECRKAIERAKDLW